MMLNAIFTRPSSFVWRGPTCKPRRRPKDCLRLHTIGWLVSSLRKKYDEAVKTSGLNILTLEQLRTENAGDPLLRELSAA